MAKIGIVLATYNGEKYLAQMLDSLVAQTRQADFIVAVDDGSKDSTPEILKKYQDRLPLQVTRLEKNSGHRAAFSKALELARPQLGQNDLIALADQDDVWLPQKLEILEKAIGTNSLVFGDAQVIDGDGKIIAESWRKHSNIETKISIEQQIAGINNVTGCLSLFRASLLKTILPIPEGVTVHDRWIAMLADKQNGVAAVDSPVVQYRIHGANAVGGAAAPSMSKTLETQIQWTETILDNAQRLSLTEKEIGFAKSLLSLTKARLTHGFLPFRLLWIAKHRNELFLKDSATVTLKRILFTAIGLPAGPPDLEKKLMRIGIDIKCLRYNNSGIGRYLISLLDELQKVDQKNEYFLFSPHEIRYDITNKNFKLCPYYGKFAFQKKIPGILWQQLTLPGLLQQYKIDVFWGPEQTLPLGKSCCKKVLTVHDFVYKRYPETMRKSVRWINNHIGEKSILEADVVAVNSGFTQSELLHFHPSIDKSKIEIVPCGIKKSDKPCTESSPRNGLLFVGSLEPRKNFKNLVKALEILDKKGVQVTLTMTGPKGWKNSSENSLLQNSPVAKNIQHLGFVSDSELQNLYANSAAVIFPSVYEGFGLPILEALNYKTPVLTTKGSVMEEIAQECGIYFDAKSAESIAQTIETFLTQQQDFLKDKEDKRSAILEKYQWKNSAKQLVQIFEQLGHREVRP